MLYYDNVGASRRPSDMINDAAKEVANSEEVSGALYIVNKIAKAYGREGSTVNYRGYNIEKQKQLYALKDYIISSYGELIGVHRFKKGWGELYKLGNYTFHNFKVVHNYFKGINGLDNYFITEMKYSNELLLYSIYGYDRVGRIPFDIDTYDFSGGRYFVESDKPTLEQFNQRYADYIRLDEVEPPRETENKISEEEEENAIQTVKDFISMFSDTTPDIIEG